MLVLEVAFVCVALTAFILIYMGTGGSSMELLNILSFLFFLCLTVGVLIYVLAWLFL